MGIPGTFSPLPMGLLSGILHIHKSMCNEITNVAFVFYKNIYTYDIRIYYKKFFC